MTDLVFWLDGIAHLIPADTAGGDTATFADAEGIDILADLDGDGTIDHITHVDAAGEVTTTSADPLRTAWGLATATPQQSSLRWGLPQ